MFTKNYYVAIAMKTTKLASNASPSLNFKTRLVALNGEPPGSLSSAAADMACVYYANGTTWGPGNIANLTTTATGYGGAILGTGTTPPTLNDYYLSGSLITTFTASASVTVDYDDDGVTYTALYTITNTGDEAFTIGEIALVGNAYGSSTSDGSWSCLIERSVLDEPVTIPAGGVGQVTYTIRMDYPTE